MEQRKFRMPTAYTILFCLILLVALSTWFIPAGSYDYADGIPISGSYHAVAPTPQGIGAALKAAFRGFYDAVDVCVFILMVGGFLGVVMKTGAIDAGVSNVITRLQGRENLLITILMLFSVWAAPPTACGRRPWPSSLCCCLFFWRRAMTLW